MGAFWRQTFSSLKVPNYRLYFTGQSISLAGTWMQMTAQSWLVLTLTHSSTDLGFTVARAGQRAAARGPALRGTHSHDRHSAGDDEPGRATGI